MSGKPQMKIGTRARSDWGQGDDLSVYAVGDVVWVPRDCRAVNSGRCQPGLHRVESVFSIDTTPAFYYRLSPAQIVDGRRIVTDWGTVSDRLHVIPGGVNYTLGWELLS